VKRLVTGLQVWLCVGLITENGNYARKNELISEHVIFPYLEDKHKIGKKGTSEQLGYSGRHYLWLEIKIKFVIQMSN
jgi:hypothetical protein